MRNVLSSSSLFLPAQRRPFSLILLRLPPPPSAQGNGLIDLPAAMRVLQNYKPRASAIPARLDLTQPYAWPFERQPLYASALPLVFNITVINGMGATGTFSGPPVYEATNDAGKHLRLAFEYSDVLWPWSGVWPSRPAAGRPRPLCSAIPFHLAASRRRRWLARRSPEA